MKRAVILLCLAALALAAGCASKEEIAAYYAAQVEARKAQKSLLSLKAPKGQTITISNVEEFEVNLPAGASGGANIPQFRDQALDFAQSVIDRVAVLAGIKISLDGSKELVNATGGQVNQARGREPVVVKPEVVPTQVIEQPAPIVIEK